MKNLSTEMKNWQRNFYDWLPNYINGSLSWPRKFLVRLWLNQSTEGRIQYESLLALRDSVRQQPIVQPAAELYIKIQNEITAVPLAAEGNSSTFRVFQRRVVFITVQILLVALAIVLFWRVIPPGNMLQWTSQIPAETFRVYRAQASAAGDEFVLVREFSADRRDEAYAYLDIQVAPGQDYIYRVETVQPGGNTAASDLVFASGQSAFMGQLLLLLGFLMVILIMVTGLKRAPSKQMELSFTGNR